MQPAYPSRCQRKTKRRPHRRRDQVVIVANEGRITTERRQEGACFGPYAFAHKLGISFGVLIGRVLPDMIGFDGASRTRPPETA